LQNLRTTLQIKEHNMQPETTTPQYRDLPSVAANSARGPIIAGLATLPWAAKTGSIPAGWALPGGARTTDEDQARAIAHDMHLLMLEQGAQARASA
jgi:hypothetical protein